MDDSRYSVVHRGRVEEVRGSTARVSVVIEDGARSCAGINAVLIQAAPTKQAWW